MRGADGGRWSRICALPALWVGLLYDDQALDAAWDLVKHWTIEAREKLRHDVPKLALEAITPDGETMRDFAGQSARHRGRRPHPPRPAQQRRRQ